MERAKMRVSHMIGQALASETKRQSREAFGVVRGTPHEHLFFVLVLVVKVHGEDLDVLLPLVDQRHLLVGHLTRQHRTQLELRGIEAHSVGVAVSQEGDVTRSRHGQDLQRHLDIVGAHLARHELDSNHRLAVGLQRARRRRHVEVRNVLLAPDGQLELPVGGYG
eukprot:scaffold2098_cov235-Pinguiococcus_pyrenoidosus.AAC.2